MIRQALHASAFVLLGAVATAHDGNIQPGCDLLTSPAGSSSYSPPLPAGFFGGSGSSVPFTGAISLGGAPLTGTGIPAGVDTIISRPNVAIIRNCPETKTIPIQIVALHLVSTSPITVNFTTPPSSSTYDVSVCLSSVILQAVGSMMLNRATACGGTFDSTLPLDLRVTFTKAAGADGGAVVVLDPAPHLDLVAAGASWSYQPAPGAPTSTGGTVDHNCDGTASVNFAGTNGPFWLATDNPGATCMPPCATPSVANEVVKHCFIGSHSFFTGAPPSTGVCFGDGTGTPCPCGNNGAQGNGCANSVNPAGGNLASSGSASLSADTLTLNASGLANTNALLFQGTSPINGGLGAPFGDGLRCAGGAVIRFDAQTAVGGAVSWPQSGDPTISVDGQVTSPGTRLYQVWYRNADPTFCTPSTFNLTNAVRIIWSS